MMLGIRLGDILFAHHLPVCLIKFLTGFFPLIINLICEFNHEPTDLVFKNGILELCPRLSSVRKDYF